MIITGITKARIELRGNVDWKEKNTWLKKNIFLEILYHYFKVLNLDFFKKFIL